MTLTTATPFRDAMQEIARRGIMPTSLTGAALEEVAEQFAEDSIFSAGNVIVDSLQEIRLSVEQLLDPTSGLDRAQARMNVREQLRRAGYAADPQDRGTLLDLTSDRRINLVLDFWTTSAREKGHTLRNNDPDLLRSHPCYELVRIGDREKKRHWIERWRGAGGKVFAGKPAGPALNPDMVEGRLIAKKDDPIWFRLSRFNRAEPPYDFNSGVSRAAVARAVCVALGVIQANESSGPTPPKSPYADVEETN